MNKIVAITASFLCAAAPLAALPPDRVITYQIHDDPTDPESRVVFSVRVQLEAADSNATQVGWDITEIKFKQIVQGPDTLWAKSDPLVGLWWVDHADTEQPVLDEFTEPPHLAGTAAALDPNDDDLDYDLEGVAYSPPPPPGEPPWTVTSALDFLFVLVGETEPIEEGDGEPVETDNDAGSA